MTLFIYHCHCKPGFRGLTLRYHCLFDLNWENLRLNLLCNINFDSYLAVPETLVGSLAAESKREFIDKHQNAAIPSSSGAGGRTDPSWSVERGFTFCVRVSAARQRARRTAAIVLSIRPKITSLGLDLYPSKYRIDTLCSRQKCYLTCSLSL